jgi:hypothetical protein
LPHAQVRPFRRQAIDGCLFGRIRGARGLWRRYSDIDVREDAILGSGSLNGKRGVSGQQAHADRCRGSQPERHTPSVSST